MASGIEEILSHKHRLNREMLAALTPEDIEQVSTAVLDRQSAYRVKAMDVMVAVRASDAVSVLKQILQADEEDVAVRAAAASNLGRLGGTDAERVLIEAIRQTKSPTIQVEIAGALEKIGTTESLEALGLLVEASEGATRQQAEFARSVIAYRYGIPDFKLPVPAPDGIIDVDRERAIPIVVTPAPYREALIGLSSLASESYGVQFSRDFAFFIECGPAQMLLILDREWFAGDLTIATNRPLLLGLIAHRAYVDGSYATRWLVLSWPAERNQVYLAAHRPSGPQVLFGSAEIDGKRVRFELRSVRGVGNVPVRFQAQVVGSTLEVVEALSEQRPVSRQMPTAMESPPVEGSP